MYCARCGTPLQASELSCAHCGADLTAFGGIRLTDPKLSGEPIAAAANEPADEVDADPTSPADPQAAAAGHGVIDPWSIGESGSSEISAQDQDPSQPGLETGTQRIGGVSVVAGQAEVAAKQPQAAPAPKADAVEAAGSDVLTRLKVQDKQWARMVGVDMARPTGRTMVALLILLGAIAAMLLLMAGFMNLDRIILGRPSAPTSTVYVTQSPSPEETTQQAPPATTTAPSTPPSIEVPKTPALPQGAKACGSDVWASAQTSCEFANAVAAQVDKKMTGTERLVVHSPVTKRDYTVECTAAEGISCIGIDANGVTIWIAA